MQVHCECINFSINIVNHRYKNYKEKHSRNSADPAQEESSKISLDHQCTFMNGKELHKLNWGEYLSYEQKFMMQLVISHKK